MDLWLAALLIFSAFLIGHNRGRHFQRRRIEIRARAGLPPLATCAACGQALS